MGRLPLLLPPITRTHTHIHKTNAMHSGSQAVELKDTAETWGAAEAESAAAEHTEAEQLMDNWQ